MSQWSGCLKHWYGKSLPSNYLSFDLETTGFKKDYDLPIDFGWTIVRDCEVINQGSKILDWTRVPDIVDPEWLEGQIERVRYSFASDLKPYHYSVERLRDEGEDPYKVIEFIVKLLKMNRDAGAWLIGMNAWFFDAQVIEHLTLEFLGEMYEFKPNELFDVGCMEKAVATGITPKRGETMKDFFVRVHHVRKPGFKWGLEACLKRYKLAEKYDLDPNDAHGAQFDSYVTHLILEANRQHAEARV